MRKIILLFIVTLVCLFFRPAAAVAYDPLSEANNKFGIHIIDEHDLSDAANLVNSEGGDWGYVTLVIREDDRDLKKWQQVFDKMREAHLIPLVRIATHSQDNAWEKPQPQDAPGWGAFFDSLNWVIKNRYVILFNEPNHDKEWGGKSDAAEYTSIVNAFSNELKKSNSDYFILSAGFDLASGNTRDTTDAASFFQKMEETDSDIFKRFDGWTSHSYPNPGFSGAVADTGRKSIQGYKWELEYLGKMGLKSDIPVFITETGWIHKEGILNLPSAPESLEVASRFKSAFETVWNDDRIVAVTPFVLSYLDAPFDHFSWRDARSKNFLPMYEALRSIPKASGKPIQVSDVTFVESPVPTDLVTTSSYTFDPKIKNTGQTVWEAGDVIAKVESSAGFESVSVGNVKPVKPGQEAMLPILIKTADKPSKENITIQFFYKGKQVGEVIRREINIIPPTALVIRATLGWKRDTTANDFKLVIYDGVKFIKEINDLSIVKGIGKVEEVHDIVPHKTYRFVLLKEYYLPRQLYAYMSNKQTLLSFPRLKPLDFNKDGKWSRSDIFAGIANPLNTIRILWPFH